MIKDTRIYLVTYDEKHPVTGVRQVLVSHGVGNNTLTNHCLPPEPPSNFNPSYDEQGPYINAE